MNTNVSNIEQFALRARYFVLRHQFAILLDNYEDAFIAVMKYANEHCMVQIEPETKYLEDVPDTMLQILESQRASSSMPTSITAIKMSTFVESVIAQNNFMPLSVRSLDASKLKQLVMKCKSLSEITAIFSAVNQISYMYKDKDTYILKRLYKLSQTENAFCEQGFGGEARIHRPTWQGKPWQLGEFPSDAELVASVFCALLDYSVENKRRHLYDSHLPMSEIAKFGKTDISIVNRQPSSIFRAHYEVYVS